MLTRKQHELLTFIDRHLRTTGFSPSFEEMKDALNLRSKSGIHRLISALEERGFLQRRHHRARALEVVRLPDDITARHQAVAELGEPAAVSGGFTPNVIRGDFSGRLAGAKAANDAVSVQLPLYGRIAAGLPIEALGDTARHIDVPATMLGSGEHFALEVDGDSMIDAGIWNGDTVIIRKSDAAETGDIVVALVDEQDVTLKRLRRRGNSIALEPANATFKTQIYPADKVRVQGKLVGLLRRY
ncbi:MAG: transcriptional repressor LexA [Alphaproteobacteria bacterium]|nr:transcriptional repressor LexA [Alphaproteobacteria bacterium]